MFVWKNNRRQFWKIFSFFFSLFFFLLPLVFTTHSISKNSEIKKKTKWRHLKNSKNNKKKTLRKKKNFCVYTKGSCLPVYNHNHRYNLLWLAAVCTVVDGLKAWGWYITNSRVRCKLRRLIWLLAIKIIIFNNRNLFLLINVTKKQNFKEYRSQCVKKKFF